jgi:hypothetical protein
MSFRPAREDGYDTSDVRVTRCMREGGAWGTVARVGRSLASVSRRRSPPGAASSRCSRSRRSRRDRRARGPRRRSAHELPTSTSRSSPSSTARPMSTSTTSRSTGAPAAAPTGSRPRDSTWARRSPRTSTRGCARRCSPRRRSLRERTSSTSRARSGLDRLGPRALETPCGSRRRTTSSARWRRSSPPTSQRRADGRVPRPPRDAAFRRARGDGRLGAHALHQPPRHGPPLPGRSLRASPRRASRCWCRAGACRPSGCATSSLPTSARRSSRRSRSGRGSTPAATRCGASSCPSCPSGNVGDPLTREREERYGKAAWERYYLPEAVIELKQAAGPAHPVVDRHGLSRHRRPARAPEGLRAHVPLGAARRRRRAPRFGAGHRGDLAALRHRCSRVGTGAQLAAVASSTTARRSSAGSSTSAAPRNDATCLAIHAVPA